MDTFWINQIKEHLPATTAEAVFCFFVGGKLRHVVDYSAYPSVAAAVDATVTRAVELRDMFDEPVSCRVYPDWGALHDALAGANDVTVKASSKSSGMDDETFKNLQPGDCVRLTRLLGCDASDGFRVGDVLTVVAPSTHGFVAAMLPARGVTSEFMYTQIEPVDTTRWFAVIGRIHGDDEDSCKVFQARSREEAADLFSTWLKEGVAPRPVDDDEIYVNYIVICGNTKPIVV